MVTLSKIIEGLEMVDKIVSYFWYMLMLSNTNFLLAKNKKNLYNNVHKTSKEK